MSRTDLLANLFRRRLIGALALSPLGVLAADPKKPAEAAAPTITFRELLPRGLTFEAMRKGVINDPTSRFGFRYDPAVFATEPSMHGKRIRMAGYALPLETKDTGITEFLLVPTIGACIHVPPPPPNQMLVVRLFRPYLQKNLFAPVWITGTLVIESAERDLTLVDGSGKVQTGYAMNGAEVAPYEELPKAATK